MKEISEKIKKEIKENILIKAVFILMILILLNRILKFFI